MKVGQFNEKLKGGNFDEIIIQSKHFSKFFDNKSNIKEGLWQDVRKMLKSDGKIRLENIKTKIGKDVKVEDWTRIISQLAFYFFPFSEENDDVSFQRLETMTPAIISPHIFNKFRSDKTIVQMLENSNSAPICNIVKTDDVEIIGEGSEGTVFFIPKWNSEVVIKRLKRIGRFTKTKVGNDVKTKIGFEKEIQEATSSSILDELGYLNKHYDGNRESKNYMITMQRMGGFFGCPGDENSDYDLYMLFEKMDFDLYTFWKKRIGTFKDRLILIWHCLFTLITLNRLGWYHNDSSPANFLVKKIDKDQLYNGENIHDADYWEFVLDGKSWSVENNNYVAKLADFGFMTHFGEPEILGPEYPEFNLTNKPKIGYDVAYFLGNFSSVMYIDQLFLDFKMRAEMKGDVYYNDDNRPFGSIVHEDPIFLLDHAIFDPIFKK